MRRDRNAGNVESRISIKILARVLGTIRTLVRAGFIFSRGFCIIRIIILYLIVGFICIGDLIWGPRSSLSLDA